MALSMRELILVTLETSSSERFFFSRAWRNLFPNWPIGLVEEDSGNNDRTSGARLPQPRVLGGSNQRLLFDPNKRISCERVGSAGAPRVRARDARATAAETAAL